MDYCQHHFQSGVTMSDIRKGQRALQPTRWDDNTSLFLSLHTHTRTHSSIANKLNYNPTSTLLSQQMFPRCGSVPQKQNCLQCPDNVPRFHELLSGFGLCCSIVRSVASSFSPNLCVSLLPPVFLWRCMMNPHVHVFAAWSTVMDTYRYIL